MVLLSNNSVKKRIDEIPEGIKMMVYNMLKNQQFDLKLDEFTLSL